MATGRLTWQNVAAPDFSGAVEAQRASALAFDSAMQRLGGAVQTFDNNRKDRADAAVMRNAMQYQNADELQAAIASGALLQGVNPDHVRVDALLKAQAQAGQLMGLDKDRQQLATAQQTYDFNAAYNPLRLEKSGLENAQLGNDITHTQDTRARDAQAREINEQVDNELADGFRSGAFQQPGAIAKWVQAAGPVNSPLAQARWQAAVKQVPALAQTFDQLGFGAPATSPLTGVGATGASFSIGDSAPRFEGISPKGNTLATAIFGQESNFGKAKTDHVNEHGVTGPMQIQDVTWREMQNQGIIPKDWDHKNPKQNIEAGYRWVEHLTKKHDGDPARVAAEYYGGPSAVNKDGTINRDRRDKLNPNAPTVGQYVDQVLQRASQASTPAARQEAGAAASQAQLAAVDAANREGVPQNQRYIKAMELGMTGKEDTSLRGTLARHKDAFSGANQEQLEKLMREANQELGGGGNYELAAQFLLDENLSQSNVFSNTWDKMFGDGGGRKFDANSVRSRIKDLKARGGFKLYNTAAAGYRANAALENQALSQQAVDDLIKRRDAAATAAQSGVQGAAEAAIMLDNQLTQARAEQSAQSAATFDGFAPAPLKAPPPNAGASSASAASPAPDTGADTSSAAYAAFMAYNSPEAQQERQAARELQRQAKEAAEKSAPQRQTLVNTDRLKKQREMVSKLSTERIKGMTREEAQEVIAQGLFPLLSPEQQRLLRSKR